MSETKSLLYSGPEWHNMLRRRLAENVPDEDVAIFSNGGELLVVRAKTEGPKEGERKLQKQGGEPSYSKPYDINSKK